MKYDKGDGRCRESRVAGRWKFCPLSGSAAWPARQPWRIRRKKEGREREGRKEDRKEGEEGAVAFV